jgi:TDG/mug DNA glycosylase family protein
MTYIQGFPPICRPDARILILGSMPSRESLARQQYYAHPRNAFWPIITALLEIDTESYEERAEQVMRHGLAIWDVLQACFRSGSLDSAIDDNSLVVNDFDAFLRDHRCIRRVFFNGAKAEAVYRKHALPGLKGSAATLPLRRLPSTSPAHAGMSVQQKTAAWRVLLDDVVESDHCDSGPPN